MSRYTLHTRDETTLAKKNSFWQHLHIVWQSKNSRNSLCYAVYKEPAFYITANWKYLEFFKHPWRQNKTMIFLTDQRFLQFSKTTVLLHSQSALQHPRAKVLFRSRVLNKLCIRYRNAFLINRNRVILSPMLSKRYRLLTCSIQFADTAFLLIGVYTKLHIFCFAQRIKCSKIVCDVWFLHKSI